MLSLKPNFCFRHCSSLLKPSSFLLIPSSSSSLRFFSSKSQNIRISPANPKNPSMSAPPRNASDVLMAAARAAAKKKTAVSSPKKRKSTQEKDPKPKESVNKDDDLQLNPEEKPNLDSNQAAAQKKTGVSSPKKRKPTQEKDPKPKESVKKDDDLQLNLEEKPALESIQAAGEKKPEASSPKKQKTTKEKEVVPPKEKSPKPEPPSPKAAKKEGKTVNIDANIAQLKKKPSDFKPKSAAYWKDGEPVPFLFLARAFDLISNESGRNASTDILCNAFRTVMATTPKDLIATVYLAANKIAPSHEGIELGIGDSYIIRVLAEAYGRKEDQIKIQLEKLGDLGLVAKASRSSQRVMFPPPPLTVVKVLDTFRAIAKESGKDSQDKKRNHIKGLLVAATDCEPQYLIRLLQSKLRTGFAEKTLLVALGHAAVYSEKKSAPPQFESSLEEAAKTVKQVFSVLPNYDKIITALLDGGVSKLSETCSFTPGVPVGPMLAKPTKGVSEILDKFQDTEFTCEYKYDGERAQIHYMDDGSVEIYSRNAERNTAKYPDVIDAAQRFKKASTRSFVLDCEVVAYDREKQKILPFQVLSTRARKAVSMNEITVKICIYAFDILYLNGKSLLQEQLKVRRELLYNSFEEVPGEFQFATATTSTDLEEIQKFLDAAVNSGCEGLIVKTLDGDATYEPSKRSNNWLKLKKDYMDSVGDSLDLVPIAAFHGRGKRTGVYGAFLLACYDDKNEEYQSICKIGTGFTEAMLEKRSASLRVKIIEKPKSYYRYAETINPDVWFEPTEVWEVKAADLSISPVHRAATGVVDPNKGISLRFPRLLRVREDKNPEQATSSDQVAEMYRSQKIHHSNNKDDGDD